MNAFDEAIFGEARIHGKWGTLHAGLRAEDHSLGGSTSAPRFAYTGVFGKFHAKLMYSNSFKMPTFQNVNVGPAEGIRPESIWTEEAEVGYRIGARTDIRGCVFHTLIRDPIVYVYQHVDDNSLPDSYANRNSAATRGFEFSFSHRGERWGLSGTLSGYWVDTLNTDLPETELPGALHGSFQALPQYKGTLIGYMKPGTYDRFGFRAVWLSESHAYQYANVDQTDLELIPYAANLRVGVFVQHVFKRVDGLTCTMGCYNILDQRTYIQSPYDNGLLSLPMNGREITFRIEYRFN